MLLNNIMASKINFFKSKQAGLSLIELMISIAVGLVVVSGVISMFVSTVKSNADNLKMTRLNQELRMVMDIMSRDIRRAGFRGDGATATTASPFTMGADNLAAGTVNVANDCISFTYDATALQTPPVTSGTLEDADKFGYRRDLDGAVGVIRSRSGAGATGCTTGTWDDLTDSASIDITLLRFDVNPSPPIAITSGAGISRTIRNVTITLTGQLRNSNPVINRTITETVRVGNDQII